MKDLKLNSNFSVELNDRNDIATVNGRDAFEQSVTVALTEFMYNNLPGLTKQDNIKQKIKLQVTRVARENSWLTNIRTIQISEKDNAPDTYLVNITYESGDTSQLLANE